MAQFVFKLNALLQMRIAEEGEKARSLAALERERLRLEAELRHRQTMIAESRNHLRSGLVGSVQVRAMRDHAASSMRTMRDAQRLAVELSGIHQRIERARADLIESTAARRAIELLRDRRFAAWKKAIEKKEAEAMDELAAAKMAREEPKSA